MKHTNSNKKNLSPKQTEELFKTLKARFEKNMSRHTSLPAGRPTGQFILPSYS